MFTFPATLDRATELFPEAGIYGPDGFRTYAEARENARAIAVDLRVRGIDAGDVVAVGAWNTPRFFELLYAVTGTGATLYPVNVTLPPQQVTYTLERAGATTLVYGDDFARLTTAFDGETIPIETLDVSNDFSEAGSSVDLEAEPDDPAVILFTSGTTGMPKAVRYTHRQMVQGSLSMAHQMAEYSSPASLSGDDTLFPGIPMYHLLAWGTSVFAPYLGADLTFAGRFDPVQLARSIEADDATWTCLVPTMATQLLDTGRDLFGLKLLVGGSVVTADLASRLRDAGIDFASIYGGTDMLAVGISIWTEHAREEGCTHVRRVTHPTPYVTVRVDEKSGNGVTDDATDSAAMGELLVRSPWLPDGYYDAPEGADKAYADGWFRTGDLGRRTEDGGIEVLDRITDAIKSGGEWIPSGVLESIVSEVDGVDAVAVLAKPDDEWGERPVAVVDADASVESELRRHLEVQVEVGRIESWWVPEEIRFVDEFPLTSTGKIRKTELRDQVGL